MTTILLLISRWDHLDQLFACLEFLTCNPNEINILAVVDGNQQLYVTARNKVEASKFNDRLCVQYQDNERMKNNDILHRRYRIAKLHNYAKQFIKNTEYILSLEDDTTFRSDALEILKRDYLITPFAGMISGVQIGRHGINHVGGWLLDDVYEPSVIKSIPLSQGIEEVDASGLYCTLIKAEHYLKHDFKPFEDVLGPDSNLGIELRRQGLQNYMNFSVACQHHTKDSIISPKAKDVKQVTFVKTENRWRQRSIV